MEVISSPPNKKGEEANLSDEDYIVFQGEARQHKDRERLCLLLRKEHGSLQGRRFSEDVADYFMLHDTYQALHLDSSRSLSDQIPSLGGVGPNPFSLTGLHSSAQRRDLLLRTKSLVPGDVRLCLHSYRRTRRSSLMPWTCS